MKWFNTWARYRFIDSGGTMRECTDKPSFGNNVWSIDCMQTTEGVCYVDLPEDYAMEKTLEKRDRSDWRIVVLNTAPIAIILTESDYVLDFKFTEQNDLCTTVSELGANWSEDYNELKGSPVDGCSAIVFKSSEAISMFALKYGKYILEVVDFETHSKYNTSILR